MSRTLAPFVAIVLLTLPFGLSCREPSGDATTSAARSAAPSSAASATSAPSAASSASSMVKAAPREADEDRLHSAVLTSLTPQAGPGVRRGVFDAVVEAASGPVPVLAEPALTGLPMAHRAAYAFYRLALALEMRVVPVTTVRAVPIAELGAALDAKRGARGEQDTRTILGSMRVQNDGTIDVLLASLSSRSVGSPWDGSPGTVFDPAEGPVIATWDRWASARSPEPGEDGHLLRDYLEMLVLDYLAANITRQSAIRSGSSIVLTDNGRAFPSRIDHPALDRLLRRLRAAARFPRGLRDALRALDRPAAKRTFNGGAFEDWLLSPRTLVELDERRAALLTLIEARIAERGSAAVLAL